MKARTVTAFGREWSHQQFEGLVEALAQNGSILRIMLAPRGDFSVHLTDGSRDMPCYGYGDTPWLALCEAVERMEEK